jgi:hypothetical protein
MIPRTQTPPGSAQQDTLPPDAPQKANDASKAPPPNGSQADHPMYRIKSGSAQQDTLPSGAPQKANDASKAPPNGSQPGHPMYRKRRPTSGWVSGPAKTDPGGPHAASPEGRPAQAAQREGSVDTLASEHDAATPTQLPPQAPPVALSEEAQYEEKVVLLLDKLHHIGALCQKGQLLDETQWKTAYKDIETVRTLNKKRLLSLNSQPPAANTTEGKQVAEKFDRHVNAIEAALNRLLFAIQRNRAGNAGLRRREHQPREHKL